jgi:hypothetical protein
MGEELLVYYGHGYAMYMGINSTQFSKGLFRKYDEQHTGEADEFRCKEKEN